MWASRAGFPWPTVLMPEWEATGLNAYGAFAGEIYLVDSSGKVLAKTEEDFSRMQKNQLWPFWIAELH